MMVHWIIEVYQGFRYLDFRPTAREAFGAMDARIPERTDRHDGDFIAYDGEVHLPTVWEALLDIKVPNMAGWQSRFSTPTGEVYTDEHGNTCHVLEVFLPRPWDVAIDEHEFRARLLGSQFPN